MNFIPTEYSALLDIFRQYPTWYYTFLFILGALVGSFLNVVIYRFPRMLEQQWRQESQYVQSLINAGESLIKPSHEFMQQLSEQPNIEVQETLSRPRSHCPTCKRPIRFYENIPLISFIFLRAQCRGCKTKISWRYPFIEALTGICSALVGWTLGVEWVTFAALIFTWLLITLTWIDFDTQLLPDPMVFCLLWLGLLCNTAHWFTNLESAVIGAAAGYLMLWSIFWLYKLLTGKEGMGYGDFKLLAALGAWFGFAALPSIILIASFTGAIVGISLIILLGRSRHVPIAFGPYLALGGWVQLFSSHFSFSLF
ncbi:MAG: A24 family peptidase [Pseudomonadota bacterium]